MLLLACFERLQPHRPLDSVQTARDAFHQPVAPHSMNAADATVLGRIIEGLSGVQFGAPLQSSHGNSIRDNVGYRCSSRQPKAQRPVPRLSYRRWWTLIVNFDRLFLACRMGDFRRTKNNCKVVAEREGIRTPDTEPVCRTSGALSLSATSPDLFRISAMDLKLC